MRLEIAPEESRTYPVPDNPWRDLWNLWRDQWDNVAKKAPTYSRTLGNTAAGLLQARPPQYSTPLSNPAITVDELAEITDEAVAVAASTAISFIRPAQVAGEWVATVLNAERVEFRFAHRRLIEAVVWTTDKYGEDDIAITEHYQLVNGQRTFTVQAWEASKNQVTGGITLGRELDLTQPDLPEQLAAVAALEDRWIYPYVWEWDAGNPAPVHNTNEHLITQLNALHDVEQSDANTVRRIIAMDAQGLANRNDFATTAGGVVMPSGWSNRKNILGVQQGALSQGGAKSFVDDIFFPDDLIQRQRITEKENALYEACGFNPQTFGRSVTGISDSGVAKRVDNQKTLVTIAGPARRWRQTLNEAVTDIAAMDNGQDGDVVITEGFKEDLSQRAETVATARASQAMSIRTGVVELHPDWEEDEVNEEVVRVMAEQQVPTPDEDILNLTP